MDSFDDYQNGTEETNVFSTKIDELLAPIERALPEDDYYAYHQLHEIREMLNYFYTVLGLVGEAGEVAEGAKKWLRDSKEPDTDEIGDVLYYLAQVAKRENIALSEVAERNYKKLKSRKERNKIHGDGDNR